MVCFLCISVLLFRTIRQRNSRSCLVKKATDLTYIFIAMICNDSEETATQKTHAFRARCKKTEVCIVCSRHKAVASQTKNK